MSPTAEQKGADAGHKLDSYADKLKQTSWRDVGATTGKQLDELRSATNERLKDSKGKTPEDHFWELYGASTELAGHTFDYAYSWVPFTQAKAKEAKAKLQRENATQLKEDAKSKGIELKDDALNTDVAEEAKQTIGSLINESRALAGKVLDTAVYYIKVGEEKADSATSDPKSTAQDAKAKASPKAQSYIDQARNLTAYILERSNDLITYGQQKAKEAEDKVKETADKADASVKTNGSSERPGFTIQANL